MPSRSRVEVDSLAALILKRKPESFDFLGFTPLCAKTSKQARQEGAMAWVEWRD
jgi:hypothetical protein